ncbi:unnamed protein product [Moneuplotes crassus]|uniref:Uncharacterized protein n=1 Tax=Euplotes crassus TaxID=5936 RepID=A0AAD1U303_EUPCR|nr:unnamed protein product [Moneuplotes crassus]
MSQSPNKEPIEPGHFKKWFSQVEDRVTKLESSSKSQIIGQVKPPKHPKNDATTSGEDSRNLEVTKIPEKMETISIQDKNKKCKTFAMKRKSADNAPSPLNSSKKVPKSRNSDLHMNDYSSSSCVLPVINRQRVLKKQRYLSGLTKLNIDIGKDCMNQSRYGLPKGKPLIKLSNSRIALDSSQEEFAPTLLGTSQPGSPLLKPNNSPPSQTLAVHPKLYSKHNHNTLKPNSSSKKNNLGSYPRRYSLNVVKATGKNTDFAQGGLAATLPLLEQPSPLGQKDEQLLKVPTINSRNDSSSQESKSKVSNDVIRIQKGIKNTKEEEVQESPKNAQPQVRRLRGLIGLIHRKLPLTRTLNLSKGHSKVRSSEIITALPDSQSLKILNRKKKTIMKVIPGKMSEQIREKIQKKKRRMALQRIRDQNSAQPGDKKLMFKSKVKIRRLVNPNVVKSFIKTRNTDLETSLSMSKISMVHGRTEW